VNLFNNPAIKATNSILAFLVRLLQDYIKEEPKQRGSGERTPIMPR